MNWSFEKFHTETGNRRRALDLMKQIADEVAQGLTPSVSPIYLYGKSGCGKTLLLKSLEHSIPQACGRTVLYTDTWQFQRRYIGAIALDTAEEFLSACAKADVFLFDGIDEMQGKEATCEVLVKLFDLLYENDRQIVITGLQKPSACSLGERLQSRLTWGEVVHLTTDRP